MKKDRNGFEKEEGNNKWIQNNLRAGDKKVRKV